MISAYSDDSMSMNKGIRLAKLWFDVDIVEPEVIGKGEKEEEGEGEGE